MKVLLTLALSATMISGCQSSAVQNTGVPAAQQVAQDAPPQTEIKQVTVQQAKDAVDGGDVQFIDVRTPPEYAEGHAKKAAHFPLDQLEKDLSKLAKDKPVYVICQSGRRSQIGAEMLQKAGFAHIFNVQGGTSAWIAAGLPTEK